ncbi:SLOG family protein [Bailinhaonella thermotolerans]|uniref:DUF2493 domain-containing protein n=1 Tax=Bailinhaonella thermotolerans TaxID=1070861 RepID=A0A3A4AP96_9ACTN|nr:SLOG family protein [Bailinhaonella thermotolerans]RJL21085.1 DUF2493 domain-containing protein [Bailinhaonella thermotolerans]
MRDRFRLLYTGARDLDRPGDRDTIWADLDGIYARRGPLLLVHGSCSRGGDAHAEAWRAHAAERGLDVAIERHPAPWSALGRAAGPYRDGYMLGRGADGVLAHVTAASQGARNTAAYAQHLGIPLIRRQR